MRSSKISGKKDSNQSEAGTSNNYPNTHFPKRTSSKRSRRQAQSQPQVQSSPEHNSSCSSATGDESVFTRHNNKSEVDYEIIRQRHYGVYGEQSSAQNVSVVSVESNAEGRSEVDAAGASGESNDTEEENKDLRTKYEEDIRPVNV